MIEGEKAIREAYRDQRVARSYLDERFRQPLGALLHDRQVTVLKDVLRRCQPQQILEIAPGPARLTIEVAPHAPRGITIADASGEMLREAKRRLGHENGARCVQGDAFCLPFRQQFDLVYTFRLIRHFESGERARLYREIRRLLRPGGLLVFDAVNERVSAPLRARAAPGEYRHYDALLRPESLDAELGSAGFEVQDLVGVQHRYAALMRLQILVAPRSRRLARAAMEVVDRIGGGDPLEWVVVCRRV